jgi:hypothetical protein
MAQPAGSHLRRRALGLLGVLLAASIALLGCSGGGAVAPQTPPPAAAEPLALEIIVRTPAMLRNAADVQALVAAAGRQGVKVINLLVKQDEDGSIESGRVYYASRLAPAVPGYESFDVLRATLEAARPLGLRVRAWVPQFHDQVAARLQPAWAMQHLKDGRVVPYQGIKHPEFFVNPLHPEVQAYQLAILREITSHYAIDGVMLDWIRFDNYPMDLSDWTRAQYQARFGTDPLQIDFSGDNEGRRQWNDFRTEGLAQYVRAVRQALAPQLELGVYILPPEFVEVGQDAARFNADVGLLAPMCYYADWGFAIDWLWASCLPSTVAKASAAAVVPTLDAKLSDAEVQRIVARLRSDFPAVRTVAWFQHEVWTEAMMARLAALSR